MVPDLDGLVTLIWDPDQLFCYCLKLLMNNGVQENKKKIIFDSNYIKTVFIGIKSED